MDASISIKRPPTASKSLAVRDPVTVREAVATDLGPSKTVNPAGDAGGRPNDQRPDDKRQADDRGEHADHAPQDVLADPESREVLYRERDVRVADRAHPDQALLRQRAYRPTPAAPAEGATVPLDPHADIKA